MVRRIGIYGVLFNSEIVYVGSSVAIDRRWKEHMRLLRSNKHHSPHWQNTYNKYGESVFTFKLLELTPKDQIIQREQFYIDLYNPKFNVAPVAGSRLGSKQSPEAIEKVRQAHLGSKHTEETKLKMSQSALGNTRGLGRKMSNEQKAKMKATNAAKKAAGIKRNRNPMSEETKEKIRLAQAGKPRAYANKPRSEETKRKISEAQKGKPRPWQRKNEVSL